MIIQVISLETVMMKDGRTIPELQDVNISPSPTPLECSC